MQTAPTPPYVNLRVQTYWWTSSQMSLGSQDIFNTSSIEPAGAPEKEKGRPRALVVDDAPDVTEMIAALLQYAGFNTVMTFSAPEALEAAKATQFEVIISDIGMPGMNGYDLAMALRALPGYENVPMIAVTGFSMYQDRERALESGFDAHMTKPIDPASLLDLIKSLG